MEVPRHWRSKAQRYRLEGSKCSICGRRIFPPRPVCLQCASERPGIAGRGLAGSAKMTLADLDTPIEFRVTERIPR